MSTGCPLSRVVVMGRDVDLWLCATAISRALGPAGVQVTAIALPTRLRPSDITATLPPLEAFHAKLGIKEPSLIRATAGSFSFGQNFVASLGVGRTSHFFHAWGAYGAPIDGSAFFLLAEGDSLRIENLLSGFLPHGRGGQKWPNAAPGRGHIDIWAN